MVGSTARAGITSALQYYSRFVPHFTAKADCLFKLQAADSFRWELQHEQCLRSLLNFLDVAILLALIASGLTIFPARDANVITRSQKT